MGGEHGGAGGSAGGGEVQSAAQDPWDALHEHIDALLKRAGLGRTQFAQAYGFNKSSVTRWCTERRLPPRTFFVRLLTAVESAAGGPLTEEVRQETVRRYSSVLDLGRHPHMRELFALDSQIEHLTAELSRAYFAIHGLQAHLARLDAAGQRQAAAAAQGDLHRARLEVTRLRAEWELLHADRAVHEEALPAADRAWYDSDVRVPGREPAPPWWPPADQTTAPVPPPSLPPYSPAAAQQRSGGGAWRVTAIVAITLLALVALAITGWGLLGFRVPHTSPGNGPASAPAAAAGSTPPSGRPTPSDSISPSPEVASDPSTPQGGAWKVVYRDQRITLPEPSMQECGLASVDFDTPRGYEDSNLLGGDDLTLQTACSFTAASPYDNITFKDELRGTSSPTEPGVDRCASDANQQGVSRTISLNDFAVGKAYCLVTPKQAVVWFKILATAGDNNKGRVFQATLWSRTGGH